MVSTGSHDRVSCSRYCNAGEAKLRVDYAYKAENKSDEVVCKRRERRRLGQRKMTVTAGVEGKQLILGASTVLRTSSREARLQVRRGGTSRVQSCGCRAGFAGVI